MMKTVVKGNTPDQPAGNLKEVRADNPWRKPLLRFFRHKLALIGLVVFILLVLLAFFAPFITSYQPETIDLRARSQGPSAQHWFGTDRIGRDTFTRTIYGGQASILVGLVAVAISVAVGGTLGAIAGFFGGKLDSLIMRGTDVFMAFPPIILILTVAAIAGPGLTNTILLIGFLNWPVPCRLMRARFLSLREQEFVLAARATGTRSGRLIVRHMLPNALDVMIVYSSLGIANAILLEAGLSFLIVLAINFIGDGLRDALDPRMKI